MANVGKLGYDRVQRRLAAALRRHVGQGRVYSVARLAAKTGIPASTLKSYLAGDRMPSAHALLCLIRKLPPAFGMEMLAGTGYRLVALNGRVPAELDLLRLVTAAAAELAGALQNGRIDHRRRAGLRHTLGDLAAAAGTWAEAA